MFAAPGTAAVALAGLLLGIAVAPAAAQVPVGFADSVLGRWDLTVSDGEAQWPSWLEVRLRTESELMGRFVGRAGSVRHLPEISFADGRLRFSAPPQYETGSRPLEFSGRLAGDELGGSLTDSEGRSLSWSGARAPALEPGSGSRLGTPVALFNGRDLIGWRARSGDAARCWRVIDGVLASIPPCVDLVSAAEFEDFALDVEFSYPAGSNSGIYLRGRYEVQIQDTAGQALDPLRMGAVYGFIAPVIDAAGAPGEWQTMQITLAGRTVSVVLNGRRVIAAERIPGITGGALDSREAEPGPIMLQGDHGAIRFRRIELQPLMKVN